jgi:hypothetical protein
VTGPVRDRMGETFQFRGPIRLESTAKGSLELWEVTG